MGKKEDQAQLAALQAQLMAAINNLTNPKSNPYQDFLGTQAINAANFYNKGEFSSIPKGMGMFYDFSMPAENVERYKKMTNVGQGGTFNLASTGNTGRTNAQGMASKYLNDRFARDASQNYQDNVRNAGTRIQSALGQASGASSQMQLGAIDAMNSMYGSLNQRLGQKGGGIGGLLGGIGSIVGSFI